MPTQPMPVCTLMKLANPQGPRPSCSWTSAFCDTDSARPPYSAGTLRPKSPISRAPSSNEVGSASVRSISCQHAFACSSTNSRTDCCNITSSADSEKPMPRSPTTHEHEHDSRLHFVGGRQLQQDRLARLVAGAAGAKEAEPRNPVFLGVDVAQAISERPVLDDLDLRLDERTILACRGHEQRAAAFQALRLGAVRARREPDGIVHDAEPHRHRGAARPVLALRGDVDFLRGRQLRRELRGKAAVALFSHCGKYRRKKRTDDKHRGASPGRDECGCHVPPPDESSRSCSRDGLYAKGSVGNRSAGSQRGRRIGAHHLAPAVTRMACRVWRWRRNST